MKVMEVAVEEALVFVWLFVADDGDICDTGVGLSTGQAEPLSTTQNRPSAYALQLRVPAQLLRRV